MIDPTTESGLVGKMRESPASSVGPIRVLHVLEAMDERYGGPAQSVPYLCAHLRRLGVDASIHSVNRYNPDQNAIITEHEIPWHRYPNKFSDALRYSSDLGPGLRKLLGPDTIIQTHNQWNYPPYCAYRSARCAGVPWICSVRGSMSAWAWSQRRLEKKILWRLFQRRMFADAACLHVTTSAELQAVRQAGIETPAALIPNGIELGEFENPPARTECCSRLHVDPDRRYVLYLSRIHRSKGLLDLVNAWIDLALAFNEWDLLVVGPIYDEGYWREVHSRIQSSGLGHRVHTTGMLERHRRLDAYFGADLFCLPSRTENFGLAIAEAMAAGLPVITTTGAPWQVLRDQDCGWWVQLPLDNAECIQRIHPSNSTFALREALEQAMSLPDELRAAKGKRAQEIIHDRFSWDIQAENMQRVYRWVLGQTPQPECIMRVGAL